MSKEKKKLTYKITRNCTIIYLLALLVCIGLSSTFYIDENKEAANYFSKISIWGTLFGIVMVFLLVWAHDRQYE